MFRLLIALFALAGLNPAQAQVGVEISLPSVSIGINLPIYPELVLLPGSPVYYAPRAHSNYFFYDGLYWVYNDDNWYSSDWYNGPWQVVGPQYVPLFILRVPVRYYRQPPAYFRGWRADAPPRWGEHWGNDWEGQRRGWNQWNRHDVPRAAPLPTYQRQYSGSRYPGAPERQQAIRSEHYRYQPREAISQEHFKRPVQRAQPEPEARRPAAERPRAAPEPRQSTPDRPRDQPREATDPRQAAPDRQPDRPRQANRPDQDARPARAPAPQVEPKPQAEPRRQAEPRQQAEPKQRPQAAPPESRPSPAEQGRQRPEPAPEVRRQPGNAPDAKRDQERGGGQSERGRDNNRNDDRGPDRRQ